MHTAGWYGPTITKQTSIWQQQQTTEQDDEYSTACHIIQVLLSLIDAHIQIKLSHSSAVLLLVFHRVWLAGIGKNRSVIYLAGWWCCSCPLTISTILLRLQKFTRIAQQILPQQQLVLVVVSYCLVDRNGKTCTCTCTSDIPILYTTLTCKILQDVHKKFSHSIAVPWSSFDIFVHMNRTRCLVWLIGKGTTCTYIHVQILFCKIFTCKSLQEGMAQHIILTHQHQLLLLFHNMVVWLPGIE